MLSIPTMLATTYSILTAVSSPTHDRLNFPNNFSTPNVVKARVFVYSLWVVLCRMLTVKASICSIR